MAYDAVAISSKDLSAGADFFVQSQNNGFPWVSANIYNKNGHLQFPPHIIKSAGDITLGIIGLTEDPGGTLDDLVISDWRKALQAEITILEKTCDLLVVLSTLSSLDNTAIQKEFSKVDIIVTADTTGRNIQPIVSNVSHNSLLIQSGSRGKYLGKIDITWHGPGSWFIAPSQSLTQQKQKLTAIDRQLHLLTQQQDNSGFDYSKKIARLQLSRQFISQHIANQETEQAENDTIPAKFFSSSFLPVKPAAADTDIEDIVLDIKNNIATYNRYRRAGMQPGDRTARNALLMDEITGIAMCTPCHVRQSAFWQKTRHAGAYRTLSQQGQSYNLQCLPCHVTAGTITPSSPEAETLLLLSLTTDRQTIGCEVCHGAGKNHSQSPENVFPVRRPGAKICTQCHTPDRDVFFDYQKKTALIACPAS